MKKTQIAILIALFGCLTATPIVAKSADKVFSDKYIYRISYLGERDTNTRRYKESVKAHFANTKKARGSRSSIGSCFVTWRNTDDNWHEAQENKLLLELVLLAYKE